MTSSTVSLAAEWARWGMDPSERGGYHLLACSEGRISPRNFEEILDRFNPGNLDDLPQVTVSYVPASDGSRYLGMAIHEAEASGADRLGRDVTVTRYFCVPYPEAASAAVSYVAMYNALRDIRPPDADRSVCAVELTAGGAELSADAERVLPVAGLLLTGNPVCIVGAEATEMAERLAYVDAVMSLLPYGMRAEMAASTWTRGTYRGHKFRLFFSEAPRRRAPSGLEDHVVRWRSDSTAVPDTAGTRFPAAPAAEYLNTLRQGLGPAMIRGLAEAAEPTPFSAQAAVTALDRLTALAADSTAQADAAGEQKPPRPREAPRIRLTRMHRDPRVPPTAEARRLGELLLACVRAVGGGDARHVKQHVSQLEEILQAAEVPDADQRQRLHDMFGTSPRLLRDLSMERQRAALYQFLLQLSSSRTVDYHGYCLLEDVLGDRPDPALLRAIGELAAGDPLVTLLVSGQLDAPRADESLRQLIELAVDPDVRPAHGRLICDLLLKQVSSATSRDIRHTLPVLRGHGYLAPALAAREPDDLRYQAETLTNLLSAVFSKSPGGGSYLNVLAASGGQAPTAALLLAVLCLTDESTAAVAASFMAGLARTAGLSGDLRDALVTKGFSVGPAEEAPERVSMSAAKRRAGVLRRMLLDPVASPSADPGDGGG
jgi:hypothetical protein